MNISAAPLSYLDGSAPMQSKNERFELETKIMKYRAMARDAGDQLTAARIETLVAELKQKLREIDE
jgi:hypothetical protein